MERYGCLVVGVVLALVILFALVYLWSGWLNRPVGRAPAAAEVRIDTLPKAVYHIDILAEVAQPGRARH